jgi:hypothetical protein
MWCGILRHQLLPEFVVVARRSGGVERQIATIEVADVR